LPCKKYRRFEGEAPSADATQTIVDFDQTGIESAAIAEEFDRTNP
jgi:hypothetical protein